jgi:hypothetical protein
MPTQSRRTKYSNSYLKAEKTALSRAVFLFMADEQMNRRTDEQRNRRFGMRDVRFKDLPRRGIMSVAA